MRWYKFFERYVRLAHSKLLGTEVSPQTSSAFSSLPTPHFCNPGHGPAGRAHVPWHASPPSPHRQSISDAAAVYWLHGPDPRLGPHCQAEPTHHEDPEVWVVPNHPSDGHQQVSMSEGCHQLLPSHTTRGFCGQGEWPESCRTSGVRAALMVAVGSSLKSWCWLSHTSLFFISFPLTRNLRPYLF